MKTGVTKHISQIIFRLLGNNFLKNVESLLHKKFFGGTLTLGTTTTMSSVGFDFVVAVGVGPVGLDRGRVNRVRLRHRGDVLDDSSGLDEEQIDLQENIFNIKPFLCPRFVS